MNIPNYIGTAPTDKDGNWTDPWRGLMIQLLNQLNANVGGNGFVPTSLTTAQITVLEGAVSTTPPVVATAPYGTIVYNSDTDNLMVKLKSDGKFHNISTAPAGFTGMAIITQG